MTLRRDDHPARSTDDGPWRFIESGPGRGSWNLALDEAIFRSVRDGVSPPTVRCYTWSPPAVSLGYGQDRDGTVDAAACRERGIEIVRRTSGGRAVLHDAEVTYSVACRSSPGLFGVGPMSAYRRIAEALVLALGRLGVAATISRSADHAGRGGRHPSCFANRARSEIMVDGRKIVGSAQRREGASFLQHGSILLASHGETFRTLLRDYPRDSGGERGMAGLGDFLRPCPSPAEIAVAVRDGFAAAWGIELRPAEPGGAELLRAAVLERETFGSEGWKHRAAR